MKSPVRSVEGGAQADLFQEGRRTPGDRGARGVSGFEDPDPLEIFIGTQRLDRFLAATGSAWVLTVREVLRELDWSTFVAAYLQTGRRPYHPAAMIGLVVYGTMTGNASLRQLERLARMDVGAMWVCGGICPDHASIGRAIQSHEDRLTDGFFEQVTRAVLKRLGSKAGVLAGDGTIIEAAGSRFRTIKLEAARQAAREAKEAATAAPGDADAEAAALQAAVVAQAAEDRAVARKLAGDDPATTVVCTTEPDAPLLRTKRGNTCPAYVASVLANEDRILVGKHVHPTSEAAALGPMVDQAREVAGAVDTVLLDKGYCRGSVLDTACEKELTVLCPSRKIAQDRPRQSLSKAEFTYDSGKDHYICPAGHQMAPRGVGHDRGDRYTRYAASSRTCKQCPLRNQCLRRGESRRTIRRFATDEFRDVLSMVMVHSRAAALLKRRKTLVEPVFSDLKGQQRLLRFHRRGLAGARLEFSLHAAAYNLRRLIARLGAGLNPLASALLVFLGLFWLPKDRARTSPWPLLTA